MIAIRKYPLSLVSELLAADETIVRQGARVSIKKCSDYVNGCLDPWDKRYHEMRDIDVKGPELWDFVEAYRDACGSHNYNLNEKEMFTEYESFFVNEHKVGLWRYYLRRKKYENSPCLIYLHGGGWAAGNVYTMENTCKLIAELSGAIVFNVDYTLAPEGRYPTALVEIWHLIQYIRKNSERYGIDKNKIMIAGDSAGGNLAAALSLRSATERNHYIAAQYLIYPCLVLGKKRPEGYCWNVNDYQIAEADREILLKRLLPDGNPEGAESTSFIEDIYCEKQEQLEEPYVSPMLAKDLSGLPATYIVISEFDVLRQQGEFFGGMLQNAGISTEIMCYAGCSHAFFELLGYVPQSEAVCIDIANKLKTL